MYCLCGDMTIDTNLNVHTYCDCSQKTELKHVASKLVTLGS